MQSRWRDITLAMLDEFPQMVLLTLPEGTIHYGELYTSLFTGLIEGMAQRKAPGGVHVLTESTYTNTDISSLKIYSDQVVRSIHGRLPASLLNYWKTRGSIVMGAWPLGYYREIIKDGKSLGYSGRVEKFGDQVVGSYADKSSNYSPQQFAAQMAAINTFSPRYTWIYGHGDILWQMSGEEKARYEKESLHGVNNSALVPVADDIQQYIAVMKKPQRVRQMK